MKLLLHNVWTNDEGEDIAEYAVMLAVILVIVVGNPLDRYAVQQRIL